MSSWSRGYLRHIDFEDSVQFITWRLADSAPKEVIQKYVTDSLAKEKGARLKFDNELGKGYGSCLLKNYVAAQVMLQELWGPSSVGTDILAFCIMPNHLHVVVALHDVPLSHWMKGVKGRTARAINVALGRKGQLWQPDYFDVFIRDEKHLNAACKYVEWNPVKAGLCVDPRDFAFSSANPVIRDRFQSLRELSA